MQAVLYERFGELPRLADVPVPSCPEDGALVRVRASGLCRSDWHAWMGHDPGVALPHVPGHEFAGVVEQLGGGVRGFCPGERVTAPFVNACGRCPTCLEGGETVCPHQQQPGFSRWGSFAELVVVEWAALNLVRLPETLGFVPAAGLGCRFATAYRAVVGLGRVEPGRWCLVLGCGGVGLAAVMVAASRGARVVAVDRATAALELAETCGAELTLDAAEEDLPEKVRELTGGGAHLSIDALGHPDALGQCLASLRGRGRHVQVGLLLGGQARPPVDMARVIAGELEILGSHGMAAREYPALLEEVATGRLDPGRLVGRVVGLESVPAALAALGESPVAGATVALPGAG